MTPAWLLDVFAGLMLAVAAVSAARLATPRPWRSGAAATDVDVAHMLMAIAMAGTLAASLTTLPETGWEVIFGLMTAWFARQVWRDATAIGVRALAGGHCAPHLVHSGAMLYMLLAQGALASGLGMGGMAGPGGSSGAATQTLEYPTLAFVFMLTLAGYSVWDLDQLSGGRDRLSAAGTPLSPAGVLAVAGAGSAGDAFPGEPPGSVSGARSLLQSPGAMVGCRIIMGVTMAFMLVIMI